MMPPTGRRSPKKWGGIQLIRVALNGESREVPENLSLEALLEWLKLPLDRVAVERNLAIVPRAEWQQTRIVEGDRLEVVHFVGGG
jgi:thiamine biosynthesis protein ThiS